jgi:hypothetical protein
MNSTAKPIIPNTEWLIRNKNKKIGSVRKSKKGYFFIKNGEFAPFKDLSEISEHLGVINFEESVKKLKTESDDETYNIYDFPCNSKPFNPVYNVKMKLPLYSKNSKSKSLYCAGYYLIKFRKGWVKNYCPKLITIERYEHLGPFKTEQEMKSHLSKINS